MRSFKIGRLDFTPKALYAIAFGVFCCGILIGALIANSVYTKSNFNFMVLILLNIPIWIILRPILKKEITEIK